MTKVISNLIQWSVIAAVVYWVYITFTKGGNANAPSFGSSLGNTVGKTVGDTLTGAVGGLAGSVTDAASSVLDATVGDAGPGTGPDFLTGGSNAVNNAGTVTNPGGYFAGASYIQPLTFPNLSN